MYIEIRKAHPRNPKFNVCNYGYFRPRGQWECIYLKVFRWGVSIYRKRIYRDEWPVSCG